MHKKTLLINNVSIYVTGFVMVRYVFTGGFFLTPSNHKGVFYGLCGIYKTAWSAKLILKADLASPVSCASWGHLPNGTALPFVFECCCSPPTAPHLLLPPTPPPTPPPAHPL